MNESYYFNSDPGLMRTRLMTRFPMMPTDPPKCVEMLGEDHKVLWIGFANDLLKVLQPVKKTSNWTIFFWVIGILTIIILLGVIIFLIWRKFGKK